MFESQSSFSSLFLRLARSLSLFLLAGVTALCCRSPALGCSELSRLRSFKRAPRSRSRHVFHEHEEKTKETTRKHLEPQNTQRRKQFIRTRISTSTAKQNVPRIRNAEENSKFNAFEMISTTEGIKKTFPFNVNVHFINQNSYYSVDSGCPKATVLSLCLRARFVRGGFVQRTLQRHYHQYFI